jgi:hypothetical protein
MIVQYQQADYATRRLTPFPAVVIQNMNSRVTDENAPVLILAPDHPCSGSQTASPRRFHRMGAGAETSGRSLVRSEVRPVARNLGPGRTGARGGEVYADVGKGRYVYTSYAWFRQLPAGVPGAYRQFANLISLSKAPR